SSRVISWSFLPGAVRLPASCTSAGTRTRTATSRSVPLIQTPSPSAWNRMFESTGSVVFDGMLAETAARPEWRFCLVMVNLIESWLLTCGSPGRSRSAKEGASSTSPGYYLSSSWKYIVVVGGVDVWTSRPGGGRSSSPGAAGDTAALNAQNAGERVRMSPGPERTRPPRVHNSRALQRHPHPQCRTRSRGPLAPLGGGELGLRRCDQLAERAVAAQLLLDLPDGVDHGGVVAAAEELADPHERHAEHLLDEIHGDLARNGEVLRAP